MLGLTPLGVFHTAVALVAVAAGVIAFARAGRITFESREGRVFVVGTVITCVTAFGIFRRGGFGDPHALAIVTLVVLGIAMLAGRGLVFGRFSPYVETVGYSAAFLFHLIPAIAETTTRLPVGAPLVASPDAPELQPVFGVLFGLFLVGAWLQVRRLRVARRLAVA